MLRRTPNVQTAPQIPVSVDASATIRSVVTTMKHHELRCVLVTNAQGTVVGIITESDIVRRLVLLNLPGKLDRKISTVMSKPVEFVRAAHLEADIATLLLRNNRRFFPVLKAGKDLNIRNVSCVLSADSLARAHVYASRQAPEAVVIATKASAADVYLRALRSAGVRARVATPDEKLTNTGQIAVIADMDDAVFEKSPELRQRLVNWNGRIVFLSSDAAKVLSIRRTPTKNKRRHAMLKPFDVSYLTWLLWRP